jgi:hypothetical protein
MELSEKLKKAYTVDRRTSHEAQLAAQFIAWGPVIFQATRVMLKHGVLEALRDSEEGLTREEICRATGLSDYAAKCLLEASLCIGLTVVNADADRYSLTKTGWFLLIDPATRVDIDFNHDVNYEGWFRLEESLLNGKPEGLRHFGDWPTVYEGLSSLPAQVQKSWFAFDHFYSDHSFSDALRIVFDGERRPRRLLDVGGNTGRWALQCVAYDNDVKVTILDLPQQLEMMRRQTAGIAGADRIDGYGINLLDEQQHFPAGEDVDAIWMSQFLDCFSMEQIVGILKRAREVMNPDTSLYIMETLWDRQKYEPAAMALTMTSLYFTAIANGNSKMYNTEDMRACIEAAGLHIDSIFDGLGHGHCILRVKC